MKIKSSLVDGKVCGDMDKSTRLNKVMRKYELKLKSAAIMKDKDYFLLLRKREHMEE